VQAVRREYEPALVDGEPSQEPVILLAARPTDESEGL